jgi:hypothetical protein
VEQWWQAGYISSDRQLKGIFTVGKLQQARGWSLPPDTFNYSLVFCTTCPEVEIVQPQLTPLPPSPLSIPSYIGDVPVDMDYVGSPMVPNGSVPYWTAQELSSANMDLIRQGDSLYITPGLIALAHLYQKDAAASNNAFLALISLFVPIFMTAFVLLMIFWFLPETKRENKAMQTKRAMLLYLPVFVVARIRSIKTLVDEIIASEAAGALGQATSAAMSSRKVAPMR